MRQRRKGVGLTPGAPGPVAGSVAVLAPARPVPPLGVQPTPYYGPRRDVTLVSGTRVVAVRDGRIPLVELRMRLPLGASGWQRPEDVDALVHVLAGRTGVTGRAEERGGSFHLSTDGQWLDINGFTPPDGVTHWPGLLGELAVPVGAVVPLRTPSRRRDPGAVADTALRGHWLAHSASSRDEQGACSQHIETAIGRPLPYEQILMEAIRAVDERFASAHEWLNACGYRADVAATRRIHPAAMDFRTWLELTGAARIVAFRTPGGERCRARERPEAPGWGQSWTAFFNCATRSVRSQVKSGSSRPKWP
nr:hypothetical protein OG296_16745 [Streptomyces sp. NBC_01001]